MSLITRCPACETMFKVVPDQLRISDGWVRCGQCGEIFDASLHLLADHSDDIPAAHRAESAAPAQSAPVATVEAAVDTEPVLESPDLAQGEQDAARRSFSDTRSDAEDDATEPSFMRQTSKVSVWRRPMVRGLLLVLLLLLLAALAVQVLRHERDRLASVEPATRPLLLALCSWWRCEVSPIRQIDSIVIESSSFSRERGETYRLGFSLKNNAGIDIAMPALELSLTDSRDQPVFRRVIRPTEFGAGPGLLAAGSEWGNTLTLSVKANTTVERVAGYRLLAFYP